MKVSLRSFKLILTSALLLQQGVCGAQESRNLLRTFDASCPEICDGSAEVMDYRIVPGRNYYWMSEEEGIYHSMNDAILDQLCPGKYRIRQVEVLHEELGILPFADTTLTEFQGASSFVFTSVGKREISLFIELNKEVNFLNYYLKAEYSIDGGESWNSSQQFHQKIIQDASGQERVHYLLNFPRSSNEIPQVIVKVFQRSASSNIGHEKLRISKAFIESKEFEEYAFEISVNQNISIRSTISNEIEGQDGYIRLELQGGIPPYKCHWNDGFTGSTREGLLAGVYEVSVTDKKNCSEIARFVLLPPEGTSSSGEFYLVSKANSHIFELIVRNLYRKPIDLIFLDEGYTQIKKFQINPLYEDLSMDLDLSFLDKGSYTATLSTSGFSKNLTIQID